MVSRAKRSGLTPLVVVLLGILAVRGRDAHAEEPPDPAHDRPAFSAWQAGMRQQLSRMLGIPDQRVPLEAERRGQFTCGDVVVEKWIFTSEPGSRVPAVFYRPKQVGHRIPCVVLTFGHGGSKSQVSYDYLGQLLAKLGIACLAAEPIGEEERHLRGQLGTRAHDPTPVHQAAWDAGRPILGKLVFDTMRGLDFVLARDDVDPERVGVMGKSLGGALAGWMAVLDPRLRTSVVCGWAFTPALEEEGKLCTRIPNQEMRKLLTWGQYLSLAAPHCRLLIANGDADVVIDRDGQGQAWRDTRLAAEEAGRAYAAFDCPDGIQCWFETGGGHRPYPLHPEVVAWLVEQLRPDGWTAEPIRRLPRINFGQWADDHQIPIETLYNTPLHMRGATVVDLQIDHLTRESLAVLHPEEIGRPEFTLEGWLNVIHESQKPNESR